MAKGKNTTVFYCQNCGFESTKWMGQCPGCREWNSFVEETVSSASLKNNKAKAIRFSTLDAICKALDCNVEDILEYQEDKL